MSAGRRGDSLEMKLAPTFIKINNQYTQVMFVSATARKGKIKLGEKEMEVILTLEYLKHVLGKERRLDTSYFEPSPSSIRRPG